MSTYSTNLGLTLIGTGEQAGTWGTTTNTNLGTLLEQSISGYVQYACTGGTDIITIPDGADGTARNMYIEFTGTGGGTVQVPAKKKLYFIYNNTSSAITVKVSGQTGVSVPAGKKMSLVNNGTDVVVATDYMASLSLGSALPVTSGGTGVTTSTGTGSTVLSTSPTLVTPILGTPTSVTLTNATGLPLTTGVTGTLPIANGGTGQTTANAALNAFLPSQTSNSGKYLTTDGTNTSWGTIGSIVSSFSGGTTGLTPSSPTTGAVTLAGTLAVANGGTGNTSAQAEMDRVAQAVTSGQYLRGNGTNVVMSAIQASDVPTLNQNTTGNAATATSPQSGGSFITTSNIGSQSVNYATSAGSASSASYATTAGNGGVTSVNGLTGAVNMLSAGSVGAYIIAGSTDLTGASNSYPAGNTIVAGSTLVAFAQQSGNASWSSELSGISVYQNGTQYTRNDLGSGNVSYGCTGSWRLMTYIGYGSGSGWSTTGGQYMRGLFVRIS